MSRILLVSLFSFLISPLAGAGDEVVTRFFELRDSGVDHTLSLTFDGDQVYGQQIWQPKEKDGARGYVDGKREGDRVVVTYQYTIEGSDQSEEQIYLLEDDQVRVGQGELVDPKNDGNLVLKDPSALTFDTVLKEVAVSEPAPGTAERKAIFDALRQPVSAEISKPVIFTGELLQAGDWVRFQGDAAPKDGQAPSDPDAQFALDLDLFALLKRENGQWVVVYYGFSGDIGAREEAREQNPEAPWVLF